MKNKFNINLLNVLACPMCKSDLMHNNNKLICKNINCEKEYQIEDGIPILLPNNLEKEQKIAMKTWNDDYLKINDENKLDVIDKYALADYKLINSCFYNNKRKIFLEIGCGRARASLLMAKNHNCRIIGLDICIEALKLANKLFQNEGLEGEFICGDILHPPFKDNIFDLIFGGGSIEHFNNTQDGINRIANILKIDGNLIITIPVISLSTLFQGLLTGNIPDIFILNKIMYSLHYKILKGSHLTFGYEKSFTQYKISKILRTGGFIDIDIGRYDVNYDLKYFSNIYIRKFLQWLINYRLFWPMIYIKCRKNTKGEN